MPAPGSLARHNTSYDTLLHPELWEKFCQYTKNQMLELVSDYGRIECLWLDGGQVNPRNMMDIHLTEIMEEARKIQPWLMVADRTVGGENENFITPEQTVPDHPINVPWESCVTLGTSFSFRYDDDYKDAKTVIHMLAISWQRAAISRSISGRALTADCRKRYIRFFRTLVHG